MNHECGPDCPYHLYFKQDQQQPPESTLLDHVLMILTALLFSIPILILTLILCLIATLTDLKIFFTGLLKDLKAKL